MPSFMSRPHGDDLDFELFSNIVLKFTSILMVVLVLLAISVGQRLDHIISPYTFAGGLARPQLYLGAYAPKDWTNVHAKMVIGLYSASFFEAATVVDPNTGEVSTRRDAETFSGWIANQPFPMLALLAGVSPGSLPIQGKETPFVVPHFTTKSVVYHDTANNSRTSPPSDQLATSFLKLWSDAYANPIYPTRAFSEYKNTRARIYVETRIYAGQHGFVIGDENVSAAQIKAGRLDFLTSLSSTNTEVVYLGDYHYFGQTESRLDFYEQNGFIDAAKHLRSRLFPGTEERKIAKNYYDLLPSWDGLSSDQKSAWLKDAKGDAKLARDRYEASMTRRADSEYRNSLLEDAIMRDARPDAYALPTSLAYPDAWRAYVEYRLKSAPTPPEWFITELLQPLGFDNRVMVLEEEPQRSP
jgi:hypothetical protein